MNGLISHQGQIPRLRGGSGQKIFLEETVQRHIIITHAGVLDLVLQVVGATSSKQLAVHGG